MKKNDENYELRFLRLENEKLKEQIELSKVKLDPNLEKDIKILVELSMKMKRLLQECRKYNLPLDLAKEIDRSIKEFEY